MNLPVASDTNSTFQNIQPNLGQRPFLTFRGFTSDDPLYGRGIEQILIDLQSDDFPLLKEAMSAILDSAKQLPQHVEDLPTKPNRGVVQNNAHILQCKAQTALLSIIADQNNILPNFFPEPVALIKEINDWVNSGEILLASELVAEDLLDIINAIRKGEDLEIDPVKMAASLELISRLIDFYIALEVCFASYTLDASILLTEDEKKNLLTRQHKSFCLLVDIVHTSVAGISLDKIITGNWPLKVWMSVGYAAFSSQYWEEDFRNKARDYMMLALTRAGMGTDKDRTLYWAYQSSDGLDNPQRFWAEGPYYFQYALGSALPFWHAFRGRPFLDEHISDPFNNDWFCKPVDWLADIATNDGQTVSTNDGNIHPQDNMYLCAWSDAYGSSVIGQKWAYWLKVSAKERVNAILADSNSYLFPVFCAVPERPLPKNSPVPKCLTNADESVFEEQQCILRSPRNESEHFIFFNGKSAHNYIARAEGHGQPDQLQLHYRVDELSYLMDAGYDHGSPFENSSWNGYPFHNTVAFAGSLGKKTGGLPSPYFDVLKMRKVSKLRAVDYLYGWQKKGASVFKGRVSIGFNHEGKRNKARVTRWVIWIEDDQNPFLIDVCDLKVRKSAIPDENIFSLRYLGNAPTFLGDLKPRSWQQWKVGEKSLFLSSDTLSGVKPTLTKEACQARETFGNNVDVNRLHITLPISQRDAFVSILEVSEQPNNEPVQRGEFEGGAYWKINRKGSAASWVFALKKAEVKGQISFKTSETGAKLMMPAKKRIALFYMDPSAKASPENLI